MLTQEFQENLTERMWKMEELISEAKNQHCLNRAKYRGLMKTQIQAYMAESVLNMKKTCGLLYFFTYLHNNFAII